MRKSLVLVTTLLIVLLYSCHRKPAADTSTKATEVSFSQPFYKHLKGTINNNAAEMELNYGGNNSFTGVYYYTSSLVPIAFYGELDSANIITLNVLSNDTEAGATFACKFVAGILQGNYTDTANNKYSIQFTEDYTNGSIALNVSALMDSFKLDTAKQTEAVSEFGWRYLTVATDSTQQQLNKLFLRAIAETDIGNFNTGFDSLSKKYFAYYVMSNKDLLGDTLYNWTLGWYSYSSMEVMYNRSGLLSFGVFNASYTGGAHGYEYTQCYTYDAVRNKRVLYDDLFNAADSLKLEAVLDKHIRTMYQIRDNEKIEDYLLTEHVEPIDNFYLTETGIVFNYPPYQIASYAEGEIKIYVPFAELQGIIKPQPFMGIAF
jgi:hypothetical protein